MKYAFILLSVLLLASCAQYDAGKDLLIQSKEKINDEKLDSAFKLICSDASVGAIRRRFNDIREWMAICRNPSDW
ncbi:MAG: hypothetical protein ABJN40_05980 [Sneathiella sp.]